MQKYNQIICFLNTVIMKIWHLIIVVFALYELIQLIRDLSSLSD